MSNIYWRLVFTFIVSYRATKVHVWAGISLEGATGICIFDGVMDGPLYIQILQQTLLPFLRDVLPHGHRFMADNDPKNASRLNQQFVADSRINCWRTPAESPDCNPIKNLWHELKEFIRRETKPLTKDELVAGIIAFWKTVDKQKCTKYIRHLRKVVPKVIELHGAATGYWYAQIFLARCIFVQGEKFQFIYKFICWEVFQPIKMGGSCIRGRSLFLMTWRRECVHPHNLSNGRREFAPPAWPIKGEEGVCASWMTHQRGGGHADIYLSRDHIVQIKHFRKCLRLLDYIETFAHTICEILLLFQYCVGKDVKLPNRHLLERWRML